MTSTRGARLASHELGRPVEEFIAERRSAGDSYRAIAIALRDATEGRVDVTDVTVAAWHRTGVAAGLLEAS